MLATARGVPEPVAMADYQATRDRLARDLFTVTEEVASYDWDDAALEPLLRRVSAAMSDEVDFLAARPDHGPPPDFFGTVRPDTAAVPG